MQNNPIRATGEAMSEAPNDPLLAFLAAYQAERIFYNTMPGPTAEEMDARYEKGLGQMRDTLACDTPACTTLAGAVAGLHFVMEEQACSVDGIVQPVLDVVAAYFARHSAG